MSPMNSMTQTGIWKCTLRERLLKARKYYRSRSRGLLRHRESGLQLSPCGHFLCMLCLCCDCADCRCECGAFNLAGVSAYYIGRHREGKGHREGLAAINCEKRQLGAETPEPKVWKQPKLHDMFSPPAARRPKPAATPSPATARQTPATAKQTRLPAATFMQVVNQLPGQSKIIRCSGYVFQMPEGQSQNFWSNFPTAQLDLPTCPLVLFQGTAHTRQCESQHFLGVCETAEYTDPGCADLAGTAFVRGIESRWIQRPPIG